MNTPRRRRKLSIVPQNKSQKESKRACFGKQNNGSLRGSGMFLNGGCPKWFIAYVWAAAWNIAGIHVGGVYLQEVDFTLSVHWRVSWPIKWPKASAVYWRRVEQTCRLTLLKMSAYFLAGRGHDKSITAINVGSPANVEAQRMCWLKNAISAGTMCTVFRLLSVRAQITFLSQNSYNFFTFVLRRRHA